MDVSTRAGMAAEMLRHAETAYPNEACGLVIAVGSKPRVVACKNVAERPWEHFSISDDERDAVSERGKVIGVWHSHVNETADPSPGDLVMIEATQLPWHIVSWPSREYAYAEPCGYKAPYEGRPFVHGILDCYAIIRDWYQRECGITLTDYPREYEWWTRPGRDLYLENFSREGFVRLIDQPFRRGDVLLMRLGDTLTTNHGVVYLGDGSMLHHVTNRLSCRETCDAIYRKAITHHLRHKDLMT